MKKKLVCLTLAIIMTATQVVSVGATREDELRAEREYTSEQLDNTYYAIDTLQSEQAGVNAEINSLDQELVNVMVQIEVLKQDIANKEVAIQQTKEDLKVAEADRDKQYEAMKKRIQYLYEKGGNDAWFSMLLEANNISDLLSKAEYTQKMYKYDRESLDEYVATVNRVKELGVQLEGEKAELQDMHQQQEAQQANLQVQLDEKKAVAEDYEAQIANAQAQAEEYAALLEQQSEEIAILEAERIAAEEEARRQAEEAAAAAAAAEEEARQQAEAEAEEEYTEDGESTEDGSEDYTETDEYGNVLDGESTYDPSEETETESVPSSGSGQAVVDYALQFVGNPYVWGGTSLTNGADCSGFVQSVYAHFGVSLSRTSESQMYDGVGVSYAEAQPGDLICYGSHIAIYMGNGRIVHASNSAPYPAGGIKVSDNAAYRTILAVRRVI